MTASATPTSSGVVRSVEHYRDAVHLAAMTRIAADYRNAKYRAAVRLVADYRNAIRVAAEYHNATRLAPDYRNADYRDAVRLAADYRKLTRRAADYYRPARLAADYRRMTRAVGKTAGTPEFDTTLAGVSAAVATAYIETPLAERDAVTTAAAGDADMLAVLRHLASAVDDLATATAADRSSSSSSAALYVAVFIALWTVARDIGPDHILDVLVRLLHLLDSESSTLRLPL